MTEARPTLEDARRLDQRDPLNPIRDEFYIPDVDGTPDLYFVGNSLGLQPKRVSTYVNDELHQWQKYGVRGHFMGDHPWFDYHALLTENMADLVGGRPEEVITMNTLTVNLHLMMASFYRPSEQRHKILIEQHAFPSDRNAVESQIRWHGRDPAVSLIELAPDVDEERFSTDAICQAIRANRDSLALILLPGVQYYTGQVLDMAAIAEQANQYEIPIGFDLAHAAGNIHLRLHDWNVDFACWCTYKYLNSGPGSLAGCFINRRHATNPATPRLAGWWGHDAETRFQMTGEFDAMRTAEGWQLSNPPILSMAAIRASLDVFQHAGGMAPLVEKSRQQGAFFRNCLTARLGERVHVLSPADESGCQLSLQVRLEGADGHSIHQLLESRGIRTDWREPNVIRAAPAPLYNTFAEIWRFVDVLADALSDS